MKKWIASILACLLLSGCGSLTEGLREPVNFYYVRSGYQTDMSSPIGSEQREAAGHRQDLRYLLAMYLMGPSQEPLRSPLPSGTQILSLDENDTLLTICLTDLDEILSDADYSLACACLSLTLLDLTDMQSITVASGSRSITMTQENVLYMDAALQPTKAEETQ